jgi:hypothetical protein
MHEVVLLELFHARQDPSALVPLALDRQRGWSLTDDQGPTFRERPAGPGTTADADPSAWIDILPAYATMQRRHEDRTEALIAAGVPDERPARYPGILVGLLADDDPWRRVDDADRARAEATRRSLSDLVPLVERLSAELDASSVRPSVEHGDLHGNNVLFARNGTPRFFDWGDAVIAHPFVTLTTTLGSIGHHGGFDPYGPRLARLRDAYIEAWTDVVPRRDLRHEATVAMDLGHIGKAAAWERTMDGFTSEEMDGFHGWTAGWLGSLVDRLSTAYR